MCKVLSSSLIRVRKYHRESADGNTTIYFATHMLRLLFNLIKCYVISEDSIRYHQQTLSLVDEFDFRVDIKYTHL